MSTQVLANEISSDDGQQEVVSKVIVYEYDKTSLTELHNFLGKNNLVGYKVTKDRIFKVLGSSVDLAGIFLPDVDQRGNSNLDLVLEIHRVRPELPIFLRCAETDIHNYPNELRKVVVGAYRHGDYGNLKELVDTYLFSRHYPSEFVSAIKELSLDAFEAAFKGMNISVDTPYIVKDKIIYGELFSLMPLESNWCRGYMMLQSEEKSVLDVIEGKKTQVNALEATFRHVNAVLGELSNMIWGNFKNRYTSADTVAKYRIEVPIIVNHARRFISFGSDDPQLCFKYTLSDPAGQLAPIVMYQKFVFSLDWSPEKYQENQQNVDDMVSNGELELF